jgi:hypothetical protein
MVCDIAPTLDLYDVDASLFQESAGQEHVLAFRLASESDHRLVLDQNPCIRFATFAYRFVQRVLQIPNLAVRAQT